MTLLSYLSIKERLLRKRKCRRSCNLEIIINIMKNQSKIEFTGRYTRRTFNPVLTNMRITENNKFCIFNYKNFAVDNEIGSQALMFGVDGNCWEKLNQNDWGNSEIGGWQLLGSNSKPENLFVFQSIR